MATFNGARHLVRQLDSIANQSRLPDHMVIQDDGSIDGTVDILHDYMRNFQFPVTLQVNKVRLGYARNFISAFAATAADLIFFCDQDDIWHPEKLRTICATAAAFPEGVITHDLSIRRETGEEGDIASYYAALSREFLPRAICFKGCSLAVKRSFVDRWGWPDARWGISHDFWLALMSTASGDRRYIDAPLVEHCIHAHNTSGWIASKRDLLYTADRDLLSDRRPSDAELLIEMVMKRDRAHWASAFRETIQGRGAGFGRDLERALSKNTEFHRNLDGVRNAQADVGSGGRKPGSPRPPVRWGLGAALEGIGSARSRSA